VIPRIEWGATRERWIRTQQSTTPLLHFGVAKRDARTTAIVRRKSAVRRRWDHRVFVFCRATATRNASRDGSAAVGIAVAECLVARIRGPAFASRAAAPSASAPSNSETIGSTRREKKHVLVLRPGIYNSWSCLGNQVPSAFLGALTTSNLGYLAHEGRSDPTTRCENRGDRLLLLHPRRDLRTFRSDRRGVQRDRESLARQPGGLREWTVRSRT
jgi:hypothetical protein